MGDRALKFIELAVAILIIVIFVTILFSTINKARQETNDAKEKFEIVLRNTDEIKQLAGQTLSGSRAADVIFEYYGTIPIAVITQSFPEGFYDFSTIKDSNSRYYLSIGMELTCHVFYDDNNPQYLVFVEKGVSIPEDFSVDTAYSEIIEIENDLIEIQFKLSDKLKQLDELENTLRESEEENSLVTEIEALEAKISVIESEIKTLEGDD